MLVASALIAGAALAGCGGSSTQSSSSQAAAASAPAVSSSASPAPTSSAPSQTSSRPAPPPPSASIQLTVFGVGGPPEFPIPKNNTCDGANVSLPMKWTAVPHGTAELALFLVDLKPSNGGLFVDWAVTGLSPTSRGIAAGTLPAGAVVGRNGFGSNGYSICPPKGADESYVARLVALPHRLAAQPGFDAQTYYVEANRLAKAVGVSGAGSYSRP